MLFYKPLYYLAHPLEIFAVWQGGMSFHGGFLGVLVALWLFARTRHKRWLDVTDFVAPLVPLGLAAGRLGNFINGELWGRVDRACPGAWCSRRSGREPRHPSQLYQFALEGLLLFACCGSTRAAGGRWARRRASSWSATACCRFVAEYAREPDSFLGYLALGLTMGQWLSLPMIAVGVVMMRVGVPARRQGRADAARPDEVSGRAGARPASGAAASRGGGTRRRSRLRADAADCPSAAGCGPKSRAEVERQREQHQRDQVAHDPRAGAAARRRAPCGRCRAGRAAAAARRACAATVLRAEGACARCAAAGGPRCTDIAEPGPDGNAGPAREAHASRSRSSERETQYNRQQHETHGGSLPAAAILVLTQLPDRDVRAARWRARWSRRGSPPASASARRWNHSITGAAQIETARRRCRSRSRPAPTATPRSRPRSARAIPTNFPKSSLSPSSMDLPAYLDWIAAETRRPDAVRRGAGGRLARRPALAVVGARSR